MTSYFRKAQSEVLPEEILRHAVINDFFFSLYNEKGEGKMATCLRRGEEIYLEGYTSITPPTTPVESSPADRIVDLNENPPDEADYV